MAGSENDTLQRSCAVMDIIAGLRVTSVKLVLVAAAASKRRSEAAPRPECTTSKRAAHPASACAASPVLLRESAGPTELFISAMNRRIYAEAEEVPPEFHRRCCSLLLVAAELPGPRRHRRPHGFCPAALPGGGEGREIGREVTENWIEIASRVACPYDAGAVLPMTYQN